MNTISIHAALAVITSRPEPEAEDMAMALELVNHPVWGLTYDGLSQAIRYALSEGDEDVMRDALKDTQRLFGHLAEVRGHAKALRASKGDAATLDWLLQRLAHDDVIACRPSVEAFGRAGWDAI